jgi:hypothetical protein
MNTPDPVPTPPAAIPWYQSAVIRGVIISVLTQVLALTHLSKKFSGDQVAGIVDLALQGLAIASAVYAGNARLTQKAAPVVVLTPTKAAKLNQETKP